MRTKPFDTKIYSGIIVPNINPIDIKKVVFLDIDGVICLDKDTINNEGELLNTIDGHLEFNDQCMVALNYLVSQTHCYIVISSSWRSRNIDWIKDIFKNRGFKYCDRIIGETMRGYHFVEKGVHMPIPRGVEIKSWHEKFVSYIPKSGFTNKEYTYLILDDDNDMLYQQKDNFIHINPENGLTLEDVEQGIKILNK